MTEERDPVAVLAQAVEYLLAVRERQLAALGAADETGRQEQALLGRLRADLQAVRAENSLSHPEAG